MLEPGNEAVVSGEVGGHPARVGGVDGDAGLAAPQPLGQGIGEKDVGQLGAGVLSPAVVFFGSKDIFNDAVGSIVSPGGDIDDAGLCGSFQQVEKRHGQDKMAEMIGG